MKWMMWGTSWWTAFIAGFFFCAFFFLGCDDHMDRISTNDYRQQQLIELRRIADALEKQNQLRESKSQATVQKEGTD